MILWWGGCLPLTFSPHLPFHPLPFLPNLAYRLQELNKLTYSLRVINITVLKNSTLLVGDRLPPVDPPLCRKFPQVMLIQETKATEPEVTISLLHIFYSISLIHI